MKKSKLVEEHNLNVEDKIKRKNTSVRRTTHTGNDHAEGGEDQAKSKTLIIMPIFIRNVAEYMIPDDYHNILEEILAKWYEKILHEIFVVN